MRLAELVRPAQVSAKLASRSKDEVLRELASLLAVDESGIDEAEYLRVLREREALRSTGVGSGVAIPHGKVQGLDHLTMAVGLSREGVDFDAVDSQPVHIFMALAAPVTSTGQHLKALARVAKLCNDEDFRRRLLASESDQEAYEVIIGEDRKHSRS